MILFKPLNIMVQGINPASSQNPRLPHTPAQEFSPSPGLIDPSLWTAENRSHRGAQALGQATGNGIKMLGDVLDIHPLFYGGIKSPCTIQMHQQSLAVCEFSRLFQIGKG